MLEPMVESNSKHDDGDENMFFLFLCYSSILRRGFEKDDR